VSLRDTVRLRAGAHCFLSLVSQLSAATGDLMLGGTLMFTLALGALVSER
jgi:hypothetical protein